MAVEYSQESNLFWEPLIMWKARPDEKPASSSSNLSNPSATGTSAPVSSGTPALPIKESRPSEPAKAVEPFRSDVAAHIGKSVVIKGELSGNEDLYLDGEVEGTIDMGQHSLIIGPNARIRAHISARDLVLHGRVEGNVRGAERVELKKSTVVVGDISTQRIVIEDGAYFKGSIDLQKEHKPEQRKAAAAAAAYQSSSADLGASHQPSFLEQK